MTKYELGQTIRCAVTVKDHDGTLVDATTINIEIVYASTKASIVSSTAMTKTATGTYKYIWQTTETLNTGQYEIEVTATMPDGYIGVDRDTYELTRVKTTD